MSWHNRRHIQNHSEGGDTQKHWGYPDRIVPCKNDPGSCAYLDTVYDAHDLGMLYVGIFWASIGGILVIWVVLKHLNRPVRQPALGATRHDAGALSKLRMTAGAAIRRHFLPDANHFVFGRTHSLSSLDPGSSLLISLDIDLRGHSLQHLDHSSQKDAWSIQHPH